MTFALLVDHKGHCVGATVQKKDCIEGHAMQPMIIIWKINK